MIERVGFTSRDGAPSDGAIAYPAGNAKAPAVVVLQEWWGLNDQIRLTAQRLADAGFVALVPDLYHGRLATSAEEASAMMNALDGSRVLSEIAGAVAHLRGDARTTGAVAVIGFCMGGALSLAAAASVPDLAAVVPFYGIPPKADWSQVRAPVQMHVARRDEWVTPAKAEAVRAAIIAGGGAVELHLYDADHAFMNERRPEVYDAAAAKTAWERALTFLRAHTSQKTT